MRRLIVVSSAALAGIALLGLALVGPVEAGRIGRAGSVWSRGQNAAGDPLTIAQARERAGAWLRDAGFDGFTVGEVMEFNNQFYVTALDASGNPAFELLASRNGSQIHPEPTMMWNTTYNPMLAGADTRLAQAMMSGGMMSGGSMMAGGMMSGGSMMAGGMMSGGSMMASMSSGAPQGAVNGSLNQPLAQPLTTDGAAAAAQAWLDANRPGLTAAAPVAFPGYVTLHTERDGKIVGMLSVQTTTGAVWEHAWHGTFSASDGES